MSILEVGRNCRRIDPAEKAAVLVDGADYFRSLAHAVREAERYVLIAGWEIDSQTRLLRGDDGNLTLEALLRETAAKKDGPVVNILSWDFSVVFAMEREAWSGVKLGWTGGEKVRFKLDGQHPLGASQHQKIVVVDGNLAFCGGLDITHRRWDTSEHRPDEPGRRDPGDKSYGPFHDVQMMVQGEAALALQEVFVERWKAATGEDMELEPLSPEDGREGDLWPDAVTPDFENVQVALSRTMPGYKGSPQVREVQALHLDAIESAEKHLFFENQYFTSTIIGEALEKRLNNLDCPEFLLVITHTNPEWLERGLMDSLRQQVFASIRKTRRGVERFLACSPERDDLEDKPIKIHSKVMVVDEELLKVGSANLADRSMGLDSECELAIEANGDPELQQAIARVRDRLLAEHLGESPGEVSRTISETGSLLETVKALGAKGRSLRPVDDWLEPTEDDGFPERAVVDPPNPAEVDQTVDELVETEGREHTRKRIWFLLAALVLTAALAAAWRFTPLSQYADTEVIRTTFSHMTHSSWAWAAGMALFIIGGLISFPVTALIAVMGVLFDPWVAMGISMGGSLLSGLATFFMGRFMGGARLERMVGEKVRGLSRRIANRGLLAVILVRIVPVAPFTVINIAAGASHIRLWDFLLGTFLGLAPGIMALTVFADRIAQAILKPSLTNLAIAALGAVAIWGAAYWLKKRISLPGKRKTV